MRNFWSWLGTTGRALLIALALLPLGSTGVAGIVNINGSVHFTPADDGGGGDTPTYTPFYAETLNAGTVGSNPPGMNGLSGMDTKVSSTITGPFGEAKVVRVGTVLDSTLFGGAFVGSGTALADGEETWFRLYVYFPSSWCSGHNDQADGSGHLKFIRYTFGTGQRLTLELSLGKGATGGCGTTAQGPKMDGVAAEISPAGNNYSETPPLITRDTWHALQFHLTHTSDVSTSTCELWVDTSHYEVTMHLNGINGDEGAQYPHTATFLDYVVVGDYYNGGAGATDSFYIAQPIGTKQTPNTLDSGGRPYISPDTDAAVFH